MTRSALYRSTLSASTCIPSFLDKSVHDRVLNWAAAMMWPTLAPHVLDLMRKDDQKKVCKPMTGG